MSIIQRTNSSSSPSIPFSILDLKAQAVRLPVSKGAQILLSELLTWSGERGYCWWSKEAIARDLNWSSCSVWRRTASPLTRIDPFVLRKTDPSEAHWFVVESRRK